nr:sesquiterpene synthase [Auriscalpium vulgare]
MQSQIPLTHFRLPDPAANWPWPRTLHVNYEEIKAEADAWLHSFNALSSKAQRAFDKCDFSLLGCLLYPHLDKERARTGCELMILFFIFDEFTDQEDGPGVRRYVDIVLDALRNPHVPRPVGEHVLGEITRSFWERAIKTATAASQRHFIQTFSEYAEAVILEAADRASERVRGIEDYLALRRLTAGPYPGFLPCELRIDLPEAVYNHPALANMRRLVAESIVLTNDTYSYNIEQAAGHDGHNIVTVAMRELHLALPAALEWVGAYHANILAEFVECRGELPSFAAEDAQIVEYVEGLAMGVRGLDAWCFESARYFGTRGREIQRERVVGLLPKTVIVGGLATPMMAGPAVEGNSVVV